MKRTIITLLITAAVPLLAQTKSIDTREIVKLEDEFGRAMMKNDPEAIGRLLADDWIIIDQNGSIAWPQCTIVLAANTVSRQLRMASPKVV
jgi:hypothetical protein